MTILGIESSAKTASAATFGEGGLIKEIFLNNGLTHSINLMPIIDRCVSESELKYSEIDLIAVSRGPGSFTGLRIGAGCALGLSLGLEKPVCGVSTLAATAFNAEGFDGIVCCVMDARRKQFYNALFRFNKGGLTRVCEDRAVGYEELSEELAGYSENILLLGDGAALCHELLKDKNKNITLPEGDAVYQRASGVCREALRMIKSGQWNENVKFSIEYLRLSQAERERKEREEKR